MDFTFVVSRLTNAE